MDNNLHYAKSGNGASSIVCFHGFGQDHRAFDAYLTFAEKEYTIYTFDLYYHGLSFRPNQSLSKKEWLLDFEAFLEKEQIDQCYVIAFSLGGRFALSLATGIPDRIKHLILIAPDGIYQNFWYRISTSFYGNWLFKYLMLHPTRFEKWLDFFSKYRLATPSMIRFAQKELKDRKNCLRVYQSWTYFKSLQVKPDKVVSVINREKVPLLLILGDKDYIIPQKKVAPKLKNILNLKTVILPLKHHHLIEGARSEISSLLNGEKL